MRVTLTLLRRWSLGAIVALICTLAPAAHSQAAGVASLTVSPASNVPHGTEQVLGTGFSPLGIVIINIKSSTGTSVIGTLQADQQGNVAGAITLPLALDADAPNTVLAQDMTGATLATATVVGLAVIPVLGNGAQISGRVGDPIRLQAVGFAPQDPITITVASAPVTLPYSATGGLSSSAEGTLNTIVTVPAGAQPGQGLVIARGSASGLGQSDTASLPINIVGTQNLVATPDPALAGGLVQIAGSGYVPEEPIAITLSYTDTVPNATALASLAAKADGIGNLDSQITLPPTAQPNSTGILSARGERSGLILSIPLPILGQPVVAISPPGAPPGSIVAVNGTGFRPGERLFVSTPLFTAPSSGFPADNTGSFSTTVMLRAGLTPGIYSVGVTGTSGDQALANLTIPATPIPALQLNPTIVAPGSSVTVRGAKFLPNEPIQLSLGTTIITPTMGLVTTTSTGGFSAMLTVPQVPASGVYALTAQGLHTLARGSQLLNVRLPVVSQSYFAEGYTGHGSGVRFSESLELLNTNPITATGRIDYFLSNGITSTVPITLPAQTHITEDVAHDVGVDQVVSAVVEADHSIAATRTISRTTDLGVGLSASSSSGTSDLSQTWYFAEGYTGVSFQEYLALFNPGDATASVVIQPASTAGSAPPAPISTTVPAHHRVTLNLRALLPNRALGLLVQSDQPIAVERVLYWGDGAGSGKFGTAVSAGVHGPAAFWSFPYASTANGDQVFLAITDPTSVAAHVQVSAFGDTGASTLSLTATIEAESRVTLTIPPQVGGRASPLGLAISSDVPVVSEEAQYFGGSPNAGTHAGSILAGTPQPTTHWAFPGLDTSAYVTAQWYVLNTGPTAATLTARLFTAQAQPVRVQFHAAAGKLSNLTLGSVSDLQSGSSSDWNSTVPVVIVQVLRGSDASRGALVAGIPEAQQ